ncbi:MAG: RrF2 family transcriptional regulator [Oscillibacter sp.]|nr:RrF2 family transcriptional regulator [Oscillibacter sp.]
MRISTKGRYALRLMVDIAAHDSGGFVSLRDAATRQGISLKYLEQIAGTLSRTGLLQSGRGAQGGYRLALAPGDYTVGRILRLTEGNLAPVVCLSDTDNQCERCNECFTQDFWAGLYATVNEYIDQFTLADLLSEYQKKAQHA